MIFYIHMHKLNKNKYIIFKKMVNKVKYDLK